MKITHRVALLVFTTLLMMACSYNQQVVRKAAIHSAARSAAVLPLLNLSTYPHAGRIVSDLLTTQVYALTDFKLMEGTAVASRLQGDAIDFDEAISRMVAQDTGRRLGVDTVIYGSVSEYRYKRGLSEAPVVGINIRMLDVKSGSILWAGSRSETGGCFWFCEDSLNRLAQKICNELVAGMMANEAQ